MKRLIYIQAVLIAAAVVSCNKQSAQEVTQDELVTFTAIWGDNAPTKTMINPADSTKVLWSPDEYFRIFSGNMAGLFYSMNINPATSIEIRGGLVPVSGTTGSASGKFWAVYPYSSAISCNNDESVVLNVNSSQVGAVGSFAKEMAPAVAFSTNTHFTFYNVCGGLRFTVEEPGIKAIKFTSTGADEWLSGQVTVEMDPTTKRPVITNISNGIPYVIITAPDGGTFIPGEHYYVMFIPGTVSGLSITFFKGGASNPTTLQKTLTVKRSAIGMLDKIDHGVWIPLNQMPAPTTVDLGLSVLWSTTNLGAIAPEAFGNYYAWGEIDIKDQYNWGNYKWGSSQYSLTKYNRVVDYGVLDDKTILDSEDDPASVYLGGGWHMPKNMDWSELYNNCTWTRETVNGVRGFRVTGKGSYSDRSIFLPFTIRASGEMYFNDEGYYLHDDINSYYCYQAEVFHMAESGVPQNASRNRCLPTSLRPVKSK